MKKYELLADRFDHKAGEIVYDCKGYDYGCALDDTHVTGKKHISVILNEDGDYPFFTVPKAQLKEIENG